MRTCVSGVSAQTFEEELAQQGLSEFLPALLAFEKELDSTPGYAKNIRGKINLPTWVHGIEEEGTQATMNAGVFWPKEVLERVEKKTYDKAELTTFKYMNKVYTGMWRDKDQGEPCGTITLGKISSKKAQKLRLVSDSSREFRDTGVDDSFRALSATTAGFQMSWKKHKGSGDGEGSERLEFSDKASQQVAKKRALAMRTSDTSDDDWGISLRPGMMTGGSEKKKRSRMSQQSDDGDDDGQTRDDGQSSRKSAGSAPARSTRSTSTSSRVKKNDDDPVGPQPPKPSPLKPAGKVQTVKVFPSEQQRLIAGCEVLVTEAKALLSSMANSEGLSTPADRFKTLVAKLEQKTTMEFSDKLKFPSTVKFKPSSASAAEVVSGAAGGLEEGRSRLKPTRPFTVPGRGGVLRRMSRNPKRPLRV